MHASSIFSVDGRAITVWLIVTYLPFTALLSYEYHVTEVTGDFIIRFRGFSLVHKRHSYLSEILRSLYVTFVIHQRTFVNISVVYSDFDVITVFNLTVGKVAQFTESFNPFQRIKSVTIQRRVERHILADNSRSFNTVDEFFVFTNGSRFLRASDTPGNRPLQASKQPWRLLQADRLWSQNLCGAGVRVGIFDTGLVATEDLPHFRSWIIGERTDWTQQTDEEPGASGTESDTQVFGRRRSIQSDQRSIRSSPGSSPLVALDRHGHGTFVAGLIAASFPDTTGPPRAADCPPPGLAPEAELHVYRVFTDTQVSYTSWFLDAFNYAIRRRLHVINLSIGGPDFLDQPFVDKVWELSASGTLLISAIGNDGPYFGTLNNPADQMDVLGVGGIDASGRVAHFSSRGMTAWELPSGYGRIKPDVVMFSTGVTGFSLDGGCRTVSGTSVASPIVTGAVALLIDAVIQENSLISDHSLQQKLRPVNPASIKQALLAGAVPLADLRFDTQSGIPERAAKSWLPEAGGIFEQGAGLVDLVTSLKVIRRMKPQASLFPGHLDLTQCPYMWPYCSQPFYPTMQPIVVNVTILNSMADEGWIVGSPVYRPFADQNGNLLKVGFTYSPRLWPWVGYLAVHLSANDPQNRTCFRHDLDCFAAGLIQLTVESIDGTTDVRVQTLLNLPIRARIIPTPDRARRVLYDQFHQLRYPSGYIPRDDLTRKNEPLDWMGDHLHTNLRELYNHLRRSNYYLEILSSPFTCFDAANYGALLLVDLEDEFFPDEVDKLYTDVTQHGLSVIVFADWYNTSVIDALRSFDSSKRRMWIPETGGANLPALNNLLQPFGIQFGDKVYAGEFQVGRHTVHFTSGASLTKFPAHNLTVPGRGLLLRPRLVDLGDQFIRQHRMTMKKAPPSRLLNTVDLGQSERLDQVLDFGLFHKTVGDRQAEATWRTVASSPDDPTPPILGVWTPLRPSTPSGRLAVYTDSDCLTSTHLAVECRWLADALLQFTTSPTARVPRLLAEQMVPVSPLTLEPSFGGPLRRPPESNLYRISNVLRNDVRFEALADGHLPPTAYRSKYSCPVTPEDVPGQSISTPKTMLLSDPQPLLLYPTVARSEPSNLPSCHSPERLQFRKSEHFQRPTDRATNWRLIVLVALIMVLTLVYCLGSRRLARSALRRPLAGLYRQMA